MEGAKKIAEMWRTKAAGETGKGAKEESYDLRPKDDGLKYRNKPPTESETIISTR